MEELKKIVSDLENKIISKKFNYYDVLDLENNVIDLYKENQKTGTEFQKQYIKKYIDIINEKTKNQLEFTTEKNSILPYVLKTKTLNDYIIVIKKFETIKELYQYINGICYILGI